MEIEFYIENFIYNKGLDRLSDKSKIVKLFHMVVEKFKRDY